MADGARIHTVKGSRRVAELCARYKRRLTLRYIPAYTPECMPIESLWNDWRDQVTHNHDRLTIAELEGDSDHYFAQRQRDPQAVLRTIGSPFAKWQNRRS